MKFDKDFYPTTPDLICKISGKIDWKNVKFICEPSAGAGHIIDYLRDTRSGFSRLNIHAIEKDENLRNMLIGAGEKVIGILDQPQPKET